MTFDSGFPSLSATIVIDGNGTWRIAIRERLSEACAPPDPKEGKFFTQVMAQVEFSGIVVGGELLLTPVLKVLSPGLKEVTA
jgi:hypothetical protein